MVNFLSQILNRILPAFFYNQIKKIYNLAINFRSINYDLTKDLEYNEKLLTSLKFDIKKIKSTLNSLRYSYQDKELSWHYHLFIGLKDYFKDKKINILEIGTLDGKFTNFISNVYKESKITTIDLDDSNEVFNNSYGRDEKEKKIEFIEKRKNNLQRENINFIKLNSINIKEYFSGKKFDLIWVDGDHLNPQVTIDIVNSLDLLDDNGVICTDDVIMDMKFKTSKYVSNEGFLTLKHFANNNILNNFYLIKRIHKLNYYNKKYVSMSIFLKNKSLT